MALVFKDDKPTRKQVEQKEKYSGKIKFTEESRKDEIYKKYAPHHSHAGFIVTIIILSILAIAGPLSTFFWAKGIGWDEAISSRGQEIYDDGYNKGYDRGISDGYNNGWNIGQTNGYSEGFENARECAVKIYNGTLKDSIYTCYKK